MPTDIPEERLIQYVKTVKSIYTLYATADEATKKMPVALRLLQDGNPEDEVYAALFRKFNVTPSQHRRNRVMNFYQQHAPEHLKKAETAVKSDASDEELLQALHEKYNVERADQQDGDIDAIKQQMEEAAAMAEPKMSSAKTPAPTSNHGDSTPSTPARAKEATSVKAASPTGPAVHQTPRTQQRRNLVMNFYHRHAPDHLKKAEAAIKSDASDEELLQALHEKYCVPSSSSSKSKNQSGTSAKPSKNQSGTSAKPATPTRPEEEAKQEKIAPRSVAKETETAEEPQKEAPGPKQEASLPPKEEPVASAPKEAHVPQVSAKPAAEKPTELQQTDMNSLQALHKVAQNKPRSPQQIAKEKEWAVRKNKKKLTADPYREAVDAVCSAAINACVESDDALMDVVDAMDEMALMEDLERNLILKEAGLASSLKQVEQLIAKLEGDAESVKGKVPIGQLIQHHTVSLETVQRQLLAIQRNSKLVREEVDAYKHQALLHSRCGVLSCDDWTKESAQKAKDSAASGVVTDVTARSSEALRSGLTKGTALVDGLVKATTSATKLSASAVSEHVDKLHLDKVVGSAITTSAMSSLTKTMDLVGAAQKKLIGAGASAAAAATSATAAVVEKRQNKSPQLPPSALPVRYSEEEEVTLQAEHQMFVSKQQDERAKEAKAIETSTRDLSRLSTLMNEKLMQQGESLLSVQKDTAMAVTDLDKATEELRKPVNSWWNATRTLILLLWIATIGMLWADHIVR